MRVFVLVGSLMGACIFGFSGVVEKKARLTLLPAAILLLVGLNEAYTDYIWEKTVIAPIRVDLLFTPFVVIGMFVFGGAILTKTVKKP